MPVPMVIWFFLISISGSLIRLSPRGRELSHTYSQMGREKEARAEGAEVLRIDPKFSWERWMKGLPYPKSEKDQLSNYLHKAGLM
jgi:hypothetical protein